MDFTCRYTLLQEQEHVQLITEDEELKESDVDGRVTHLKKAMSRLTIRMY